MSKKKLTSPKGASPHALSPEDIEAAAQAAEASRKRRVASTNKPSSRRTKGSEIAALQAQIEDLQRRAAEVAVSEGRTTTYRPEFAVRATGLCLLGYTNADLGEAFGVKEKTIEQWIRDNATFAGAVYDGREGALVKVASAMHKAACGYEHPEDDIRAVSLGGNAGSEIVITPTIKRYPPNYNAAALILANRLRQRWDRTPGGAAGGPGDDAGKSKTELAAEVRAAVDAAWASIPPPEGAPTQEQS